MPITKGKIDNAEEALKAGMEGMVPIAAIPRDDDDGSSVVQKDPDVELRREGFKMMLGIPPYEGLIIQTTNYDHPVQAMMMNKDLTDIEFFRALGMSSELYHILRGTSFIDQQGNVKIGTSGFLGHLRNRQALLYPGIDGMEFHTREQLSRGQRRGNTKEKDTRAWYKKLFGGAEG